MAEQGFQEKTEKATPRQREKSREEGRVAKSVDLNAAVMTCLGFGSLLAVGPYMADQLKLMVRHMLSHAPAIAAEDPTFVKIFGDSLLRFFTLMAPMFVLLVVFGVLVNIVQVGFKITPKAIKPKFEKLDVLKGLKQKLSVRTLVIAVRDTIKLFIVGFVAYKALESEFEGFFLLPEMDIVQLAATMANTAIWVGLKIGAAMLFIAVMDYAYQRYEFEKSIKMSKQDIRDEYKTTDGNPQIKARVRQIQREMSRARMMDDVPKADVVVTNPTQIAVALKYDRGTMDAPLVLAKGERLIAQKIKELAREHDIPVVEDKPLARTLFKLCDVGQVVPDTLYRAVAELLAYVYRLKGKGVS